MERKADSSIKTADQENESAGGTGGGSAEASAKAARQRAKERARNMHSRLFNKEQMKPVASSRVGNPGISRNVHPRVPPRLLKKKLSEFSLTIDSISEGLTFDESGLSSSFSSVTHDASWTSSRAWDLQLCLPVPQGPSLFDSRDSKGGQAPKMPSREESIRGIAVSHEFSCGDVPPETASGCAATKSQNPIWVAPAKEEALKIWPESIGYFSADKSSSSDSCSGVSFFTASSNETLDRLPWESIKTRCLKGGRGALRHEPARRSLAPRMPCRSQSKEYVLDFS